MDIAPRRLTRQRGHSFGIGQERPKAGASRQWKGCESLPESQHCRQRREEYCSCEIASGLNREDPPSPTLKNAWWLWGYHHSVGKLEVSLQCQLVGWGSAVPPGRKTTRSILHSHQDSSAARWGAPGLRNPSPRNPTSPTWSSGLDPLEGIVSEQLQVP